MLKPVTVRKLIQKLRALGWGGPFSGGRHLFMQKWKLKLHIPSSHHSKDISAPLLKEILRQGNIATDEWENG